MYRFRVDDDKLVLQVYVPPANNYGYGYEREGKWRDATVEDIPVADPFRRDQPRNACLDVMAGPGFTCD